VKSEAKAIGFCHGWPRNWKRLDVARRGADRGREPDDAGSLLRRLPLGAGDQVPQLHPGPLGAPRGRRERRPHGHQRARVSAATTSASSTSWARTSRRTCVRSPRARSAR
jgi:hypothetical protein